MPESLQLSDRRIGATGLRIGRAQAAARLNVPLVVLDDWLNERNPMPDPKLVALVDLLDETNG